MSGLNDRFSRTELLLGAGNMAKIYNAGVTITGLGAVGSHAVESLARSGVGSFTLVDFDVIKPSNFNRQLFAVEANIGRKKTLAAKERILSINPDAKITIIDDFCHKDTVEAIFSTRPDVAIDAIDSVGPKAELLSFLAKHGIPAVSSMGAALLSDPAFIRSGDISETSVCKLAFEIRKRLRREGVTSGIRCIFSTEQRPKAVTAPNPEEAEYYSRGRARAPMGSLPMITGIFGYYAALEALKIICGR